LRLNATEVLADPERIYLNKKIGLALYTAGDSNEAVKMLEKAAEKTTDDLELFLTLGKAYYAMKQLVRPTSGSRRFLDPGHKEARAILDKCL
jgi:Flp pilus assembly protein TadD